MARVDMRHGSFLFLSIAAIALGACSSSTRASATDASPDSAGDAATPPSDGADDTKSDEGPSTAGFGERCDETTSCSIDTPLCVAFPGDSAGYCTTTCRVKEPCEGGPPGTISYCLVGQVDAAKWMCGFFCEFEGKSYECPPTLKRCEPWVSEWGVSYKICLP